MCKLDAYFFSAADLHAVESVLQHGAFAVESHLVESAVQHFVAVESGVQHSAFVAGASVAALSAVFVLQSLQEYNASANVRQRPS